MKTLLFLTIFLGVGTTVFASEECSIKAKFFDLESSKYVDSNYFQVFKTDTWEQCYTKALKIAQQYDGYTTIKSQAIVATEYYNPRTDSRYNSSALLREGKAKMIEVDHNAALVYSWNFNDSYIYNSKGKITKFSSVTPAKGYQAVNSDQSLVNP